MKTNPDYKHEKESYICKSWVSFPDKPEIVIDKINPETLVEGNFTRICCQAKSNPKAMTIEWKKNGESVLTGNESRLCLEFTALNRSNTGRYTCKATNTVGQTKQSMFYKVLCK